MRDADLKILAASLQIFPNILEQVATFLADGATIPFLARYRKEATGGLDEVKLLEIREALEKLDKLRKREAAIVASLQERELLTPALAKQLAECWTLEELEDLYLPYKVKRKTRATAAREKGLEPLAQQIYLQQQTPDPKRFVNPAKGVNSVDDALAGARDIIAEMIAENAQIRSSLREFFATKGEFSSKLARGQEAEGPAAVFRDYFDYAEPAIRVPSHRALAVLRGSAQGVLSVQLRPDKSWALERMERIIRINPRFAMADQLQQALEDSYQRLLMPSLENEALKYLKAQADDEAVAVFGANLKKLLLEAPLGRKRLLAVDPGFRTGCKTAVLSAEGELQEYTVLFPDRPGCAETVKKLVKKYDLEAVAVGNGTAGRETEAFIREHVEIPVLPVNESGASIYSASDIARKEFPDLDLTVRSAISIGRRLQDPLAELVKIDAKSIGVGQYQHDVNQDLLKKTLDEVVIGCVNAVGVEVNSASAELLTYVAGLGPKLAENIVAHRQQNGPFASRAALKKVKGLGPKAFEQAAGFLRIAGAKNPLDASAVHPEAYDLVKNMAADQNLSVKELMAAVAKGLQIDPQKYVSGPFGLPTVTDILKELAKPGRDPRPSFEAFAFDARVHKVEDLELGMKLPGIVTNVTKFGAFVDIGVHQDGLLHISKMARRFISDPHEIVSVQDKLEVTVVDIDLPRKRISLSLVD